MTEPRPILDAQHPSLFLLEELKARGWSLDRLAHEMDGEFGINRLTLDLWIEVGPTEPGIRVGPEGADIGRALGVSELLMANLEAIWLRSLAQGSA